MIKQIIKDLRSRLTLVGRIPPTLEQLTTRLIELDGAREDFIEAGIAPVYNSWGTNNNPSRGSIERRTENNTQAPKSNNRNYQGGQNNPPKQTTQGRATFTNTLTPEERERRRTLKLCYECGKPGHYGRNCEEKEKGNIALCGAEIDSSCACDNCLENESITGPTNDNDSEVYGHAAFNIEDDYDDEVRMLLEIGNEGGLEITDISDLEKEELNQ
ncbi:hypothetical protein GYMLUDRAFT_63610 [Collybiopsis luxurians FD-317 M1]|uniref:CCHC-type domain-containing protein n=1 Tax=Collybiopsis luxurians FD-317 M1 TaxID=944289 RepID=A0A0D0BVE7_9AGAR|nr:hypothetical protein GYMLUDRAFT_63610 [Collybiopsis luxurians FD-317 M1]